MTITQEGEQLIAQIDTVLNDLLDLHRLSEQLSTEASGPLVVGTSPYVIEILSQVFLGTFIRKYPDIELQFQQVSLSELDDAIATMDIVLHVGLPNSQSISIQRMGSFPTGFYASEDYLARHGVPEHPSELSRHYFLSLRHSPWGEKVIPWQDADGTVHCESAQNQMSCDSISSMLQLVKQGVGVMLLPHYLVRKQAPELKLLFGGEFGPDYQTYAFLPSARLMPSNVSLLLQELEQLERAGRKDNPNPV